MEVEEKKGLLDQASIRVRLKRKASCIVARHKLDPKRGTLGKKGFYKIGGFYSRGNVLCDMVHKIIWKNNS